MNFMKMNRRKFIRNTSYAGLLPILGINTLANTFFDSDNQLKKKNWIWLMPDLRTEKDEWKRRFEELKNALKTLLFDKKIYFDIRKRVLEYAVKTDKLKVLSDGLNRLLIS